MTDRLAFSLEEKLNVLRIKKAEKLYELAAELGRPSTEIDYVKIESIHNELTRIENSKTALSRALYSVLNPRQIMNN